MADRSEVGWGFLLFIFAVYVWTTHTHLDETGVYMAYCNERLEKICTDEHATYKAIYKASFESQTVVMWRERGTPAALQHCVVGNGENWHCGDKAYATADTFTMIDGVYSEGGPYHTAFLYPIGKWKWRWLYANDWASPYFKSTATKKVKPL